MPDKPITTGRFAPSPTGPLHLGSLYTALASFLQARSQQGRWLIRIDDLDTPRNRPGSVTSILNTLESLGLYWDGEVAYQSQHLSVYQDTLDKLIRENWLYRCDCSRKMLITDCYSGRCRERAIAAETPHALRVKTDNRTIHFTDGLQGAITEVLTSPGSDFIVKRKDHIIAYQFAVVVDDHLQHVNEIVRGCDLLSSTPKQIYLQQLLGHATPRYLHVPVIVDAQGQKLSKQTLATAVDTRDPSGLMFYLLDLLGQHPPTELKQASITDLLAWAIHHWHIQALVNQQAIKAT